ncbi:MAG: WbqC family protein, partial [Kiritimatiellia bacterium]|nr:WbqC family protein [Kiritimatiellia bacterium]
MKCAIHQPQFLPWLGYLHKIHNADKFVFLDNVQFKKNEFQNRNRLLVAGAARWLTVPVSFKFGDTLREVAIATTVPWRKKMLHTLDLNYARTPCFAQFREGLVRVIEPEWKTIAELNEATVRWLMECFDIHTETFTSSRFPELSPDPTQRLIEICRRVGADTYLSGVGARKYLELSRFEKAGIRVEFQEFIHPQYPQPSAKPLAGFVPCLSAIDGLFNCGGGVAGRK